LVSAFGFLSFSWFVCVGVKPLNRLAWCLCRSVHVGTVRIPPCLKGVSLSMHRTGSILCVSDWVIQGMIVLLVFVRPWFLRPGQGFRAFFVPFCVITAWGVWRFAYFDPATHNDIPGIGYFVSIPYSFLALLFFKIRCAIL